MPPEQAPNFFTYLVPDKEPTRGVWFYDLSQQVKEHFSLDHGLDSGVPELSQIGSISDLFDQISVVAEARWEQAMLQVMQRSFSQYTPSSPAGREFISSLSDEKTLFQSLANNRNWQFESLRKQGDPELWYSLILAISEREQLKARLLNDWAANASADDESRWGISKFELQIYAGLILELQPNLDQIYVKQMRISDADQPWSKNPPAYGNITGSASFYIIESENQEEIYTFEEVFPEEISNMKRVFAKYSEVILAGIASGKLSSVYQDFPEYLSRLSNSFSLGKEYKVKPADDSQKAAMFQAAYDSGTADEELCVALVNSGCPIIINPPGYIGETCARIDMEMLIGLSLGSNSTWYLDGQNLSHITAELLAHRNLPAEDLVPILHQKFLSVNGSNITYTSLASAGSFINFNDGRHIEVGRDRHERFKNIVQNIMSEKQFIQAIAIATMTHELGHLVMFLDTDLYLKLGASFYLNKLEELKADLVGTVLFQELLGNGLSRITANEYIEQYLLNYIDDILDAPADPNEDKTPAWYAFDIKVILHLLFESKAIKFANGRFEILDGDLGVTVLADYGHKILDLYKDPTVGPEQIKSFVIDLEGQAEDNPQYREFLSKIKAEYAK